ASISKAHEARRSAGHWKRKLRMRNGCSAGTRAVTLTSCSFPSAAQGAVGVGRLQWTPPHTAPPAKAGLMGQILIDTMVLWNLCPPLTRSRNKDKQAYCRLALLPRTAQFDPDWRPFNGRGEIVAARICLESIRVWVGQ